MTKQQVGQLHNLVLVYFELHKRERVTTGQAAEYFEMHAGPLTRPIEHTLQVHGVVGRPGGPFRWPYQMQPDAWLLDEIGQELWPAQIDGFRSEAGPLCPRERPEK